MNFRLRHLVSLTLISLQSIAPLVSAATYGPHPYWDADNNVYDLGGIPLRINSGAIIGSGNLGIGVLNPGYRVDVDGYINTNSGFCIGGSCIADWANITVWNKDIDTGAIYYTGGVVQIGTEVVPKGGTNILLNVSGSIALDSYRFFTNQEGYDSIGIGKVALNQDSSGSSNIAIGKSSLGNNTIGERNIAIGSSSMLSNLEGSYNIGIGESTFYMNDYGNSNIAIGDQSMFSNTNGYANIAIGRNSLRTNVGGNQNVAVGFEALYNSDTSQNTAIGYQALYSNQSISNTALGWNALYANTTGYANSAIGWNVMSRNIDGAYNVAFGENALIFNENGGYNTALGNVALSKNVSGNYNVGVGYMADVATGNLDNAIAIGYRSYVTASNTMVLGGINGVNGATSDTQVVIGETEAGTGNLDEHYALDVQNGFINSIDGFCIAGDCIDTWLGLGGGASLASGTTIGNTLRWTGTGWSDSDVGDILVNNITIGLGAGNGEGSTAIGYNALANNTTGGSNTAIGAQALTMNDSGFSNVAIGEYAMRQNDSGFSNVAVGNSALRNNFDGSTNTAIGYSAMQNGGEGGGNTAIGFQALMDGDGVDNIAIGNTAGSNGDAIAGDRNIYIGKDTYFGGEHMEDSIFIGTNAGGNGTGSITLGQSTRGWGLNSIAIGGFARVSGDNSASIGYRAPWVNADNTMVLGSVNGLNGATADTQVVIGSDSAGAGNNAEIYRLDVQNGFVNSSDGFCINGDCKSDWSQIGGYLLDAAFTGNTLRWTGTGWSDSNSGDLLVNGITIGKGVNSLDNNTVFGREALASNPGDWNTAIGTYALRSSLQNWNTAIGYAAMYQNTYGYENTAIGHSSLANNTTGVGNISLGFYTLGMNQIGGGNVAVGNLALGYQENGNNNVAIGNVALLNNGSGSSNLGIGYRADVAAVDLTNASAIGANAYVSASNTMVLGSVNGLNGATADTQVVIGSDSAGLGNNAEVYRLDVQNGFINSSNGFCINGDCKSNWSQVAGSRYPGCNRDDIQLANGQIWAGCDVYFGYSNGGFGYFQWGEMIAWDENGGTTAGDNAIVIGGVPYRSSSLGAIGYSGWATTVSDTEGLGQSRWYGTPSNFGWDSFGPCAVGYHVPDASNWQSAINTFVDDAAFLGAFNLYSDSYRSATGTRIADGNIYYWTSSPDNNPNAQFLKVTGGIVSIETGDRAMGLKIRCLKNGTDTE